jgi:integrase
VRRRCSTCARYAARAGESTRWVCPVDADHPVRWSAVVDIAPRGAQRRQVRKSFDTKDEALAWLAAAQVEAEKGDTVDPSRLTFGEYLTGRWLPAIEGNLRPSTSSSYRDLTRLYVLPSVGSIPLQSLTADQLTRLYTDLGDHGGKGGRPLSRRTVRYCHTVIHRALRDAERWRLIRRNVAALADPPSAKSTKPKKVKAWNADQLRAFFDQVGDDRLRPLWWFFATTGVRRGEAAGLRWENVDLEAGAVAIVETRVSINYRVVDSDPKTERGRRRIALDPETVRVLREWRKVQLEERVAWGPAWTDTGHVFTREDGTPWHPDRISKIFLRLVAETGLPRIPVHSLRHTSASLALANGVPLKVVQERLGHSSIAITADVYSHVTDGMDRDAAMRIAGAMMGDV